MRAFSVLLIVIVALCRSAQAKEKGIDLKSLPVAVRAAVQDNLRGGDIRRISKEAEDGVEQYEVASRLNGKERDFSVDSRGVLLVVEEETVIGTIPPAAKASILKKVGSGKVVMVETLSKPGRPILYEAGYTNKAGKKYEVLVKADGTETKE